MMRIIQKSAVIFKIKDRGALFRVQKEKNVLFNKISQSCHLKGLHCTACKYINLMQMFTTY